MDDFDRASAQEQAERQLIIEQHQQRRREPPLYINGEPCCRECEISIKDRIVAGINACRCIECQQWHEHRERHYAHG